jgi:magnesium chelatase family protein
MAAREKQGERLCGTGAACNAHMDAALLRTHVAVDEDAERALLDAYRRGTLSARGRDRALRVARTVADLGGVERVRREDIAVALGYRHDQELSEGAVA